MLAGGTSAGAQARVGGAPDSARAGRRAFFAPAFSRRDVRTLERLGAAAAVAFPLDEWIHREAATPWLHGGAATTLGDDIGRLGLPGVYYAAYAIYAAGALGGRERIADAGFHTLASVVIATHIGELLKAGVGRARPNASRDAARFAWGSPLATAAKYSFPSGHATAAFAAASALAEELRSSRPGAARVLVPALYTAAGLVGASRVYGEAHWASDVVAGAALGTFTARAVVRAEHAHRRNVIDRVAVHAIVAADDAGRTLVGFSSGG